MLAAVLVAAIVVAAAAVVAWPGRAVGPLPNTSPVGGPGASSLSFELPVTHAWPSNVPVVELSPGQVVTIAAMPGNARVCPTCPATPDGETPTHRARLPASDLALVPGLWQHGLVCKVGLTGAAFNVGSQLRFASGSAGRLYCSVNDAPADDHWGWADNAGGWAVTVTIE